MFLVASSFLPNLIFMGKLECLELLVISPWPNNWGRVWCMPSSPILASVVALSLIMLNVVILNVVASHQGRGVLLHIVHYMVPCADRLYFEVLN